MKKRTIIALLVSLVVLSLVLIGCSSGTPPQTIVDNFLSAVQAGDIEKAATYVAAEKQELSNNLLPQSDEFGEEMATKIFSHISYEIKSQQISGEEATVNTSITSLDLVRVVTQTMSELMPMAFAAAFSEEEQSQEEMDAMINQYLINSISDPNAPTTTNDITIHLKKIDGNWLIIPNDDLLNGLTGNAAKAFEGFE